jgi:hypothetical protein
VKFETGRIVFANGKKRAQVVSDAQDDVHGSVTVLVASGGLSGSVQQQCVRHGRPSHRNLRHGPAFGHGGDSGFTLGGTILYENAIHSL